MSRITAACTLAALVCAAAAPSARRPVVADHRDRALGDSYISGEAGRWEGNSNTQFASRDGTDRAYTGGCCSYDTSRVYLGGSDDNGCHRSDLAEILSNAISVAEKVNLACSGATTANVIRASQGGQSHDGEAPQADQLVAVAQRDAVKLVVLSIGGNDLGFADIIQACATDWTTSSADDPEYCYDDQQPQVAARMPGAMAAVGRAVDEVRAVMADAGYAQSDYPSTCATRCRGARCARPPPRCPTAPRRRRRANGRASSSPASDRATCRSPSTPTPTRSAVSAAA